MRRIVGLSVVLLFAMMVGLTVDGGWFSRRAPQCTPKGCKPPMEAFPIDEVPIPIQILEVIPEPTFPEVVPEPDFPEPTVQNCTECERCDDLAARLSLLESNQLTLTEIITSLPPVTMEIHHPDGTIYTQSKPLGEPIRLRLVPQ